MYPKRRFFCALIQRSKMLFASETKAMNFIRFNADEMKKVTGYAPVRAYYCNACGGWHLTSKRFR